MSVASRFSLLSLFILPSLAAAQTTRVEQVAAPRPAPWLEAAYANVPIRLDGRLDESVWRAVKPGTRFLQKDPQNGAPATHATEVRMIVTNDAVVIGARLHEDRSRAGGADGDLRNDFFEMQIDPHLYHVTAFAVSVSPSGGRRSWIVAQDGSRDPSWDLRWDAATHVDDDGWTVEIRIPLSEFHIKPGTEAWGVQFSRFSWRRQETDVMDLVPSRVATRDDR